MKKLSFVFILFLINSCWAPRCPIDGCQFVREHRHSDLVQGTFRSQYMVMPRVHFFWDSDFSAEKAPETEFVPQGKRKVKVKKKYPWERW